MWKYERKVLDDSVYKISILKSEKQITYSEVIELWQQDNSFRTFFISLLTLSPFPAYFWETPPVTLSTVNQKFEFVMVNSHQLARVSANYHDFRQYFQSAKKTVVTFPNLGGDALLIAPCPITHTSTYPHLASFVREAPESQQHLLWQTLGQKLEQLLNQQPIWVSTSGLGVYWLHIRLDSYPKYYCYRPYKS